MSLFKTSLYQYVPAFNFSSVLTTPLQLIANGVVGTVNTVNNILDLAAPIGLAGNQILGKPFEVIHNTGDQIINAVSASANNIATALGATIKPADTHYKNEWVDQEFNNKSLIPVQNKNSQNITKNSSNSINEASITSLPQTKVNQTDDATNTQDSKALSNNKASTTSTQITNPPQSANSVTIANQTSYKVSDSAYQKVQELYNQLLTAPTMQVNNLWRPIYTTVKEDLASNPDVDQGTKNWLKVVEAVAIADAKSFLYQFVRLGTGKSLAEKDVNITDPQFYQASNVLAKTLAENFLHGVKNSAGEIVVPQGYLPSADGLYGLVRMDATQALKNLGGTLGDWTGITPFSILDHYLGVDTSEFNGGASRPIGWYLELVGEVVTANLKAGASLTNVISQVVTEGVNFIGQFIQGEIFHNGFSSQDQLVNTLTQIAYAYAGDLAGPVAIATNIFNPNTNIITATPLLSIFGTTLNGKDGNDVINGGISNDKLYGGKGDDLLFGGWGNDILDGGSGINVLVGGKGNDTYYVQSGSDFILEHANEGTDNVISTALSFTLSKNVENLTLAGTADISGTGNILNNIIIGNNGNNELYGLGGDDVLNAMGGIKNLLNGGSGNDTLIGSSGAETYEFNRGFGKDVIQEKGGNDTIKFGKDINIDDLIITSVGSDRIIAIKDTTDQITIKDWAKGTQYQVESIVLNNGDRFDLQNLQALQLHTI